MPINHHKFLLYIVVFLGAFLLFVLEPFIGRLLLPFLGGNAHIWLVCLMSFQGLLLLGYLYAHFIAPKIGFWHLCVLFLPLINLPFPVNFEPNSSTPIPSLLLLLLSRFALPFAVLSTTTVVVQSWMARFRFDQTHEPYPLYAASNAGSLIGLVSYPFVVESLIGLRTQSLIWASCYLLLILLISITGYQLMDKEKRELGTLKKISDGTLKKPPLLSSYGIWLLLSGLPSALLLSVTNFISMEIGSFPMIWVLSLTCYLASFIVTFRTGAIIPKLLNVVWPEILLMAASFYFVGPDNLYMIFACLLVYFFVCVLAHGKLYENRPPPDWLTNFYLTIAVGGFIGGIFVSLIAPLILKGYVEYLILIFNLGVLFWWLRDQSFKEFFQKASFPSIIARIAFTGILITLLGMGTWRSFHEGVEYRHRNFYGTYRIVDDLSFDKKLGGMRMFVHGKTLHGAQMLEPSFQMMTVSYYYKGSGFYDVYETTPKPIRSAVIGLGAGVMCAFVEEGETITFFEIDPDVYEIAKRWFTYLKRCKGEVKVITGDGRLSMKQIGKEESKYDIIIIDAFTGSTIPIHLLTKEAIEVYLNKLAEDGIILFHISNNFYNLRPVIKSTSMALKLYGIMNPFVKKEMLKKYQNTSNCVAVTRNPMRLQALIDRGWVMFSEKDGLPKVKPWTDDYVNILSPLIKK
jgi:spermidine synthase